MSKIGSHFESDFYLLSIVLSEFKKKCKRNGKTLELFKQYMKLTHTLYLRKSFYNETKKILALILNQILTREVTRKKKKSRIKETLAIAITGK